MNTIYKRQNEDVALTYQALARCFYNKADIYDMVHWASIIISVIFKFVWPSKVWVDLVLISLFLSSYVIESKINNLITEGAMLKKHFDLYVFGLTDNLPARYIDRHDSLIQRKSDWFNVQKQNTESDEPPGVKKWYNLSSEMDEQRALKKSIGDNVNYDKKINEVFNFILFFIFILLTILFINITVVNFLSTLFLSMASLTDKIIRTKYKIKKSNRLCLIIENEMKRENTKEEYIRIINLLTEKRKIEGVSLNVIYTLMLKYKMF